MPKQKPPTSPVSINKAISIEEIQQARESLEALRNIATLQIQIQEIINQTLEGDTQPIRQEIEILRRQILRQGIISFPCDLSSLDENIEKYQNRLLKNHKQQTKIATIHPSEKLSQLPLIDINHIYQPHETQSIRDNIYQAADNGLNAYIQILASLRQSRLTLSDIINDKNKKLLEEKIQTLRNILFSKEQAQADIPTLSKQTSEYNKFQRTLHSLTTTPRSLRELTGITTKSPKTIQELLFQTRIIFVNANPDTNTTLNNIIETATQSQNTTTTTSLILQPIALNAIRQIQEMTEAERITFELKLQGNPKVIYKFLQTLDRA